MRILIASSLLLATTATAAAQEATPEAAGPFPNLATLDRQTDHTSFNTSLALSMYGDMGPDLGLRWDIGGQYVAAQGFGGYASLPVTYLDGGDDTETEIGNAEIGGLYVLPAGTGLDVVLHGGLGLPTGPDDLNVLVNYAAIVPRLTDLASIGGDTTWLRLGASPLYRSGNLFFRADAGLDIVIDEPDTSDTDPLVRLNLAAGYQAGSVSVAGELVTLGTTGDVDDTEDRFIHTAAVSVGFDAGSVRPYGALVLPLDDQLKDFLDIQIGVMAGVEVPLDL